MPRDAQCLRHVVVDHDDGLASLDELVEESLDELDGRRVESRKRLVGQDKVRLVVNTDSHEVDALAYAELGIAQARRAWLTKDQIVNTRTWKQIEKLKK